MRTFLLLWLTPSSLFWSWHLLSTNDVVFPKAFHDQVFVTYGELLGMEPAEIPALFAHAFATDSLLILAVLAFRKRRAILAFLRGQRDSWLARRQPSIEISRSSAP